MWPPKPQTTSRENWPPDYLGIQAWRQQNLIQLVNNPKLLIAAKKYYQSHPVEWINQWCITYDPRVAGSDIPTKLPFILFPRQAELVQFLYQCLLHEANGLVEKSRDMGATWICVCFADWLWRFWPGSSIGFGSKDRDLVDKLGDPDSILEKLRMLNNSLPAIWRPKGFSKDCMPFMRIVNPENSATITGDCGDNIGRGGRKKIYFKDESAHYERPERIEAALSETTRVSIDISSVNGLGNVFHRKRESGVEWRSGLGVSTEKINVFVLDWSDHPTKTLEWHESRRLKSIEEGLQHIFAQEVDRNYSAAVVGVIIPADWVTAAIDAHLKLPFAITGQWGAALDVADGGDDTNALAKRRGSLLVSLEEWGERDTGITARRAIEACKGHGRINIQYDCIGVGAGIKAETNRLKDEKLLPLEIHLTPWDAAAKPLKPEGRVIEHDSQSPLNKDFYYNLKAQAWWQLRQRFERTYRAMTDSTFTWEPDELISIPSDLPLLHKLRKELSQPTASPNSSMKLVVDKKPEGARSPNLADAVVMAFWPCNAGAMIISDSMLQRSRMVARR